MDGVRKALGKVSGEGKSTSSSSSSPLVDLNGRAPTTLTPPDSSLILATRPTRQVVSYWTCSKLCIFCFVAGVVFGYTLRGRVRRWASKILTRLKDN